MPYNDKQVPALAGDLQRVETLLLDTLQAYRAGLFTTQEELLQAYVNSIALLDGAVNDSLFEHNPVLADTEPSIQWRNDLASGINKDLVLLFFEMNQLAVLMTGLFNQQVSEADDLVGRIKRVNSKLGDYQLIVGEGGISIGEQFFSTANLDIGSTLISTEEATVLSLEGAVVCKENEIKVLAVSSVTIDSANSNGVLGNNEEIGITDLHNDVAVLTDGNPDSWIEYELVEFEDEVTEALRLRLIFKLSEQSIMNRLEIDPVNFGQLSNVSIKDIRVSADGQVWTSIVGDIPLAEYLGETEGTVNILSASSSKFSGKYAYTFLPRKVSHIAIDIEESSGFLIETDEGPKKRFVIGLKSVDFSSVKFASTSQLVSTELSVSSLIDKMALVAAYRPVNSDLGSVEFDLSFDGGTTWESIQPISEDDLSAPEVISVTADASSFRYKLTLTRNDSAFSELDDFDELEDDAYTIVFDRRGINTNDSPAVITLNRQMANSTITVMNGPIGSRSKRIHPGLPRFELGVGTGDQLTAQLPFDLFPETSIRKTDVRVYVAGNLWTQVVDAVALVAAAPEDRVYYISEDNEIVFGDGDVANALGNGRAPKEGAIISVALPPEELHFTTTDGGYIAQTDLASSGNKKTTKILHVGQLSDYVSEVLSEGLTTIELSFNNIDEASFSIFQRNDVGTLVAGSFITEVASQSAVIGAGQYYIDYVRGIIYLYTATSNVTTTAVYKYYPHEMISDYEWRLDDENRFSGLFIPEEAIVIDSWTDTTGAGREEYTFNLGAEVHKIPGLAGNVSSTSMRVLELSQKQIISGSLVLQTGIFGASITPVEVTYVDGYTELQRVSTTTSEVLAPITVSSPGVSAIQLQGGPNIVSLSGVSFSNQTIFDTEVVGTPAVNGEYAVDLLTGIVSVYLSTSLPDNISVSYYVYSSSGSTDGRYSVDYRNGIIYSTNKPSNGYTVDYDYTKYRISYPVARVLEASEYTVDTERNTVTIQTEELHNGDIIIAYPFSSSISATLSELIEYYTPLVRDLRWRILTRDM